MSAATTYVSRTLGFGRKCCLKLAQMILSTHVPLSYSRMIQKTLISTFEYKPSQINYRAVLLFVTLVSVLFLVLRSKEIPLLVWSVANWTPIPSLSNNLQHKVWDYWDRKYNDTNVVPLLELPRISIQDHDNPLEYLVSTYGKSWRDRPLLLQGLWNSKFLLNQERRLSVKGLKQENLTIPFFTDAREYGALTPDSEDKIRNIMDRILDGFPHKIATQLLVQTSPELVQEIAPLDIVTELFGDHFCKKKILGHGIFPATTTVPVFIANGKVNKKFENQNEASPQNCSFQRDKVDYPRRRPFTALHCEPIGNVAVQLSGVKRWTLIDPKYSNRLRPSLSSDGRAFFSSWAPSFEHVPRYQIETKAGDALWIPTWTWHSADYIESDDISIGASLFHFRPIEFLRHNSLYALLIIPSLVKELAGVSTQ